jgi:large subunit ribosomal protein L9
MEVLLTQDVEKLGLAGEVHKVAPGYARNFLIPRNLAIPATVGAKKQAEQIKRVAHKQREKELYEARSLASRIQAIALEFRVRVGEKGRLYGSVTGGDIAEQLSRKLGETVEKRQVNLTDPIKTLGDFPIIVRVGSGVTATVQTTVLGENGETAADFAPKPASAPSTMPQPTYDFE